MGVDVEEGARPADDAEAWAAWARVDEPVPYWDAGDGEADRPNEAEAWPRWHDAGWARPVFDATVLAVVVVFTLVQLHPRLLIADTTPAGGDMGAHVWGPAYLRDHLLPEGRLAGWAPDWYAGFPAYTFYMVVPSLAIVLLNTGLQGWAALLAVVAAGGLTAVALIRLQGRARTLALVGAVAVVLLGAGLPYGIAFKVVTVLGVLGLPVAAYAFGRLAGLGWPTPALLGIAMLPFLFNREPLVNNTGNIIGGNVASTMAGEFAFSISLTLAVLYLGVMINGLRTGRYRALGAVLLALVALCHVIVAVWVAVATVVAVLLWPGLRRLQWLATTGPVAVLVTAVWTLPFVLRRNYSNDMGWQKVADPDPTKDVGHDVWDYLVPGKLRWVVVLAVFGAVLSIVLRLRPGILLAATTVAMGFIFYHLPEGRLWNARVLPFWMLGLFLLAGVAVGEVARTVAGYATLRRRDDSFPLGSMATLGALCAGLVVVGLPLRVLPFGDRNSDGSYDWLVFHVPATDRNVVSDWARWNYSGYERKAAYPEYHDLVATMTDVGQEHGCGRAMWEYESERLNSYGTPMAPMLLPFWTDGCIGSMEGLYFEASATTPYHFINQGELSTKCSCALRFQTSYEIEPSPYKGFDIEMGVDHLQLMGVRYYLAFTPEAVAAANTHQDLTEIATSGPWRVYEVAGSAMVEPLRAEPAVITGESPFKGWVRQAVAWYIDPARWDVMLAASGPDEWQRVTADENPTATRVDPVEVSAIEVGRDRIEFDVDEPGTPVLVKASYFPNWQVSGADGPYRVAPNLMVVIPTDTHVELRYGTTPVDVAGWGLTLLGIAGVVLLARRGALDIPVRRRELGSATSAGLTRATGPRGPC